MAIAAKSISREQRRRRVRKKVSGSAAAPRLCVFRSSRHIYAQLIDDEAKQVLAAASTNEPEARASKSAKTEAAREVGKVLAARAKALGLEKAIFDRAGYLYHGRIKALADGAREGGLKF